MNNSAANTGLGLTSRVPACMAVGSLLPRSSTTVLRSATVKELCSKYQREERELIQTLSLSSGNTD